ncbi:hypothetical protein GGI05_007030, partial [Coemansia sp. RSA 2603]
MIDKSMPFLLATVGGMAVVVACTAYGAYTVMTVYGPADGKVILGGAGKWDHARWVWLPMVPIALIWSRFQAGAAYMPLSTLLMTAPQPLRVRWPMSPSLTLTVLPTVSALYRYAWDMTLGRLERRWETETASTQQQPITIRRFGPGNRNEIGPAGGVLNNFDEQVADVPEEQRQFLQAGGGRQQIQPRADRNFEATIILNGPSL